MKFNKQQLECIWCFIVGLFQFVGAYLVWDEDIQAIMVYLGACCLLLSVTRWPKGIEK